MVAILDNGADPIRKVEVVVILDKVDAGDA